MGAIKWLGALMLVSVLASIIKDTNPDTYASTPAPVATKKSPAELARKQVTLETQWKKAPGDVMLATFTVTNNYTKPVADIGVTCMQYSQAGNHVGTVREKLATTVQPGQTRTLQELNLGFISQQAKTANCYVFSVAV